MKTFAGGLHPPYEDSEGHATDWDECHEECSTASYATHATIETNPGPRLRAATCAGLLRRNRLRFEWLEDRTLLSTFLVTNTADSGPGSLRQAILDSNAATGQTNTIDFNIPGEWRADDRPALRTSRDHAVGPDRRLVAAGLRRHAADRDQRQPGRLRRRPDDHRLGCHGPRAGHRRFRPGCRHSPHRSRRDRRLDLRQLPRHRSDRHAGRPERRTASRSTGAPRATSSGPTATASNDAAERNLLSGNSGSPASGSTVPGYR